MAQAFDRVKNDGLLYKIKLFLPATYYPSIDLILHIILLFKMCMVWVETDYNESLFIKIPNLVKLADKLFNVSFTKK